MDRPEPFDYGMILRCSVPIVLHDTELVLCCGISTHRRLLATDLAVIKTYHLFNLPRQYCDYAASNAVRKLRNVSQSLVRI